MTQPTLSPRRRVPYAISEGHTAAAEYFSIFAWLWFLHRCRVDGPIHLGMRHPWEHDDDDAHHSSPTDNQSSWDAFTDKAVKMNDDDDDDDEEDDDDDE